jgi:MoaA/NifB/PqqE/SkfB family radical SAM enzyme
MTEAMRKIDVWNSRGQLFISRQGVVTPHRTLPIPIGDVRNNEIRSLLYGSTLMQALNDPSKLSGNCGGCGLGGICGGSRARAWRLNRDPLSADPGCPWTPEAFKAEFDGGRMASGHLPAAVDLQRQVEP